MLENVADKLWEADRLDRRADAEFLYNFLTGEVAKRQQLGRRGSYVLNIDAGWGAGKSFFLERLEQQLANKGHLVASMNAWRDDHAEDPYIAIMAAIDKAFAPYVAKEGAFAKGWRAAKNSGGQILGKTVAGVAKHLAKRHLGISADELFDIDTGSVVADQVLDKTAEELLANATDEVTSVFDRSMQTLIDRFQQTEAAVQTFKGKMADAVKSLSASRRPPMFILVDELDRCRPTYAIQLLERVKHLFEVDGVVFIFATNSSQLRHSIAGAYGPSFDGYMYLKRFFDRTYAFAEPNDEAFLAQLCGQLDNKKLRAPFDDIVQFISKGRRAYDLDLRATEHIVEMIDATVSAWPHRPPVELVLLLPLCATFYLTGDASWSAIDDQKLALLSSSRFVETYRGRQNVKINTRNVFLEAINRFHSLEKITEMNRSDSDDPTLQYTRGIFEPEWNGIAIDSSQPSVQRSLALLVANVGRLVTREEPDAAATNHA